MKSSLKAYHGRMRENFAHGLELLVYFQIGMGFRIIDGFCPTASFGGFSWYYSFGKFGAGGGGILSKFLSKCLSFISSIVCQELGYICS